MDRIGNRKGQKWLKKWTFSGRQVLDLFERNGQKRENIYKGNKKKKPLNGVFSLLY